MVGESLRKLPSDSSASATRNSPCPRRALAPRPCTRPPTTTVGSRPPASSTAATMEVVVVLPWVPPMAMPYLNDISSASISARPMTGMPRGLGVLPRDRRGIDPHVRALHVARRVAEVDLRPQPLEPLHRLAAPGVGAGDPVAEGEQHLGDAAHADAADAHEVDVLVLLEH